jgi:hypothetical protein
MQGDGHALIPNVGDFVQLDNSKNKMTSIKGRVRSRAFFTSAAPKASSRPVTSISFSKRR